MRRRHCMCGGAHGERQPSPPPYQYCKTLARISGTMLGGSTRYMIQHDVCEYLSHRLLFCRVLPRITCGRNGSSLRNLSIGPAHDNCHHCKPPLRGRVAVLGYARENESRPAPVVHSVQAVPPSTHGCCRSCTKLQAPLLGSILAGRERCWYPIGPLGLYPKARDDSGASSVPTRWEFPLAFRPSHPLAAAGWVFVSPPERHGASFGHAHAVGAVHTIGRWLPGLSVELYMYPFVPTCSGS